MPAAPALPYCTTAQLRQRLPQVGTTPADTALLASCAVQATGLVGAKLQLLFAGWDATVTARACESSGGSLFPLPPHLAGSVTLVEWLGPLQADTVIAGWTEQADGQLYLPPTATRGYWPPAWQQDPIPGIGRAFGGWDIGRYQVTARWAAGGGYGPVPVAVTEITLQVAVNLWRSRDMGMYQTSIGVTGQGALQFIGGLNRDQLGILADVRREYIGVRI